MRCLSIWQHSLCLLSKCLASLITGCDDHSAGDVQLTPTNWLISSVAICVWNTPDLDFFSDDWTFEMVSVPNKSCLSAKRDWAGGVCERGSDSVWRVLR